MSAFHWTHFLVLALSQLPCSRGGLEQVPFRIERGVEMLLDRVCPGGGWNAGNGVVYGAAMAPHPDDTAIALLALCSQRQHPLIQSSVKYLEQVAPTLTVPWSLAWTILALAAYQRPVDLLHRKLLDGPDLQTVEDTSTLALTCLALDH